MTNQSPWAIGEAWHDQRDLYTRGTSIEADGYGRGPSVHPEKGSYEYVRPSQKPPSQKGAGPLYAREAWPKLNYKRPSEAFIDEGAPGVWGRLKSFLSGTRSHEKTARRDRAIEDQVRSTLVDHPAIDTADVTVLVVRSEVTLSGTVDSERTKHLAAEVALDVQGVQRVHNELTVRDDEPTDANVAFVSPLTLLGT